MNTNIVSPKGKVLKTGNGKGTGSGRRAGSFSFVTLPLESILGKFADKTTPVIVSRKWAESLGFTDLVAKPADATTDSILGQTPATKIGVVVTEIE
jgi:hypothetical protein